MSIKCLTYYAKNNVKQMKSWNKKYNHNSNKQVTINPIQRLNKFDLHDHYNFCTLKDYLFNNLFKDVNSAVEYLEFNLHKVCVRVDDYMITKKIKR